MIYLLKSQGSKTEQVHFSVVLQHGVCSAIPAQWVTRLLHRNPDTLLTA